MNQLMLSGIELMIIGMSIVYLFLAMLVTLISVMSKMIARHFPDETADVSSLKKILDPQIVAAITAAIHQYRHKL